MEDHYRKKGKKIRFGGKALDRPFPENDCKIKSKRKKACLTYITRSGIFIGLEYEGSVKPKFG